MDPQAAEAQRQHIAPELKGVEKLAGTHPFTLESSHQAWRLNDFLHRLIEAPHRARFKADLEGLMADFALTPQECAMVRERCWIEMIHYGVTFFVLEKMAPVVGWTNPEVYASMRGETLEEFQKTRNVAIQYSVAGGDKARELDK